jgi:hypothetical protein
MRRPSELAWAGLLSGVLILLMLTEFLRQIEFTSPAMQSLQSELIDISMSKSTQIPIVVALTMYSMGLLWITVGNRRGGDGSVAVWKYLSVADACKFSLVVLTVVGCVPAWTNVEAGNVVNLKLGIDQTTNSLVLLTGLVVGGVAGALIGTGSDSGHIVRCVVLTAIPLFLAGTSLFQMSVPHVYKYHDVVRWTGLWVNPNTYGLLMGTGVVLALGQLLWKRVELDTCRRIKTLLLAIAVVLCGLGLARSFSRGAWLATAIALAILVWLRASNNLRRNLVPIAIFLLAALLLSFWQFRYTENTLMRRVYSAANRNDYSWRNRVTVWHGSVQMVCDRPLLGFGWGRTELAYQQSYRAKRLDESMAIYLNDYLTLATSVGALALVCALIYVGLRLRGGTTAPIFHPQSHFNASPRLCDGQAGCDVSPWMRKVGAVSVTSTSFLDLPLVVVSRAGVAVLMIGFWFDGGLFKLAIGPLFWVLVEFSRVPAMPTASPPEGTQHRERLRYPEIALRLVAGLSALAAIGWTATHLIVPRLEFTEERVAFARKYMVPPKARADFDCLAQVSIWQGQCLRTLLDHTELANYNRSLVNWKLEDVLYQDFVLYPGIEEQSNAVLNWRRPFWEYFYPRIRKESSLESAADIVFRQLNERIEANGQDKGEAGVPKSVASKRLRGSTKSILDIWESGSTNDTEIEIISVAALRSVGIPARLNDAKKAEFWNGTVWRSRAP